MRKGTCVMLVIRISRPKRDWSVSLATVLPTALLVRLFRLHWNYTVVLDHHSAQLATFRDHVPARTCAAHVVAGARQAVPDTWGQTRSGTEPIQPGEQSEMIGDVSRSAAQNLPAGEQHLGVLGLDLPSRQDEIDAMRHLPGGEVFGPERCRAAPLERVVQRGARNELAEQGTVMVDIEVPAHHSRDRDAAHDTGQSSELSTVNRAEPVRRRPDASTCLCSR